MKTLTKCQNETLKFITKFIRKNNYSPSIMEIQKKFKLKSTSSAFERIYQLYIKGYLNKEENTSRSIKLVNNIEQDIIKFIKNFNPRIFNHRERYRNLIEILKDYQNKL